MLGPVVQPRLAASPSAPACFAPIAHQTLTTIAPLQVAKWDEQRENGNFPAKLE